MRRRDVLRSVGVAALTGTATAGGHPTASGTTTAGNGPADDGDTTETAGGFAPLASLPIEDAREAVVGPDGTTAYLAVDDGFAVVDVADPAAPEVLAERRGLLADAPEGPMRAIQDVSVDGDRLLVVGPAHPGIDGPKGALLYDVSEPTVPELVAVHRTEYPIHNGVLAGGRAYLTGIAAETNPLVILAANEEPRRLGTWSPAAVDDGFRDVPFSLWPLHDLCVRGDVAYCCYWDAGTWFVDVSDPSSPRPLGHLGGRAAAPLASVEDVGVEARELPGNHHSCDVDDSGDLLALGHEAWDADDDGEGGPGGIDLVDVSDAGSPAVLATIEPPPTPDPSRAGVWTTAHNFELRGGYLYSAWYQGGVRVHDVSDPTAPREVAAWRDAEAARFWTAQVGDEVVVASSMGTDEGEAALYTFPDPVSGATGSTPMESATPVGETRTDVATNASDVTASPGLPGFGVGTALLGVGLSALVARRERRDSGGRRDSD